MKKSKLEQTMDIRICPYEDWMKHQVVSLFCNQYGVDQHIFDSYFDKFYDAPFQKEKGIRIVATEGEKVVGFQSFFYWPYKYNQKVLNSFQSGNSLVHPSYRGKGIFQQLLNYIYEHNTHLGLSFLMGFPVEASVNSFIRNKWFNILNLQWYVKPINPLYMIGRKKRPEEFLSTERTLFTPVITPDSFRLSYSEQFITWRKGFTEQKRYFSIYENDAGRVQFEISVTKRKKIIPELIIGDIRTSRNDTGLLEDAFNDLIKKCIKSGSILMISVALNHSFANRKILEVVKKSGFKKINKSIYFIVKPFSDIDAVVDPEKWELYRNDIDTW